MGSNAEISESLTTLEDVGYPRDEDGESKRRDDEAGKFDDEQDNRIHCLVTRDLQSTSCLSINYIVVLWMTFPSTAALVN